MEIKRLKCEYKGRDGKMVTKPYGAGAKVGNLIFLAGMAGIDPETNQIVMDPLYNCRVDEIVKNQTEVTIKKIDATLKKFGASLKDIIKITTYLTQVETFPIVVETMKKLFPADLQPESIPHTAFEIPRLVPPGAYLEIEVIAVAPEK